MISLNSLSKTFGDKVAVSDLSLEVPTGKIFGFLGPNGAGKSTTIKIIVGIEKPTSGEIIVNGLNTSKDSISVKKQMAYVPDEPVFYDHMTGIQYLNFIADMFEVSEADRKDRITHYADLFDLSDSLNKFTSTYSRGMKQKLSLIAAFVHLPKIIILDEPMVGLDAKAYKILKDALCNYAENGNTIFYSTHVMDVAERFCDNIAIINKGELIYSGTFEDLKNKKGTDNSTLEELFLELTEV